MFAISEAQAAAIRPVHEQRGELSAIAEDAKGATVC
jgi:hypothetical protein